MTCMAVPTLKVTGTCAGAAWQGVSSSLAAYQECDLRRVTLWRSCSPNCPGGLKAVCPRQENKTLSTTDS